jgi:hypothetical protein
MSHQVGIETQTFLCTFMSASLLRALQIFNSAHIPRAHMVNLSFTNVLSSRSLASICLTLHLRLSFLSEKQPRTLVHTPKIASLKIRTINCSLSIFFI